jgi:Domain of unknown function (DUF4145)
MGFIPGGRNDPDPEPNPDTPPDSADPTGICPRCGRNSNFRAITEPIPITAGNTVGILPDGTQEPEVLERVSVFYCMGCGEGTVVVEEEWIGQLPVRASGRRSGGRIRYHGIHWWPPVAVAGIGEAVPAAIRECFSEGLRCLSSNAPRGAAVMFRRTLEAVVRDKGSAIAVKAMEDGVLADGLRVMAAEHSITPALAEWAKELRLAGNVGGHYDPMDDVTPDEADGLSKLLRQLLIYLYEVGAQIKRARQSGSLGSGTTQA